LGRLYRLGICVCFANQLLLITINFTSWSKNANRYEQSIFTTGHNGSDLGRKLKVSYVIKL